MSQMGKMRPRDSEETVPLVKSGLEANFRSLGPSGNNSSPSVPFLNPWHSAIFSTDTPSNHTWEILRPNSALKSTGDKIPRAELPSHGAGRKGWVEFHLPILPGHTWPACRLCFLSHQGCDVSSDSQVSATKGI